jgi:cobalt-zinc-cadmium efflux system protein
MTMSDLHADRARRLVIALGLNLAIVAGQLVFGFIAHSLGLLADAGHNLTDVAAVGTSLIAVRWATRRPTEKRSFGYHRATILAALTNALSILVVTVVITFEGIRRLMHPQPVHGGLVVGVALFAAVGNAAALLALRENHAGHDHAGPAGGDLNMRSAVLHMAGDTAASLGVAVAGLVILLTGGFEWLDPAVSLAIGLLIAWQAIRLMLHAVDVLLESTPTDIDLGALTDFISQALGVDAVHDVHVWSLSSEMRAMSAHLILDGDPTLREAQTIGNQIKSEVSARFGIGHATLELEGEHCNPGVDDCAIDERAPHNAAHT